MSLLNMEYELTVVFFFVLKIEAEEAAMLDYGKIRVAKMLSIKSDSIVYCQYNNN